MSTTKPDEHAQGDRRPAGSRRASPCSSTAARASRKETLHLPGPDFVDRVFGAARTGPMPVLRSLQQLFDHGRLAGTGYLSILPVDQGIEHSAGASFAHEPDLLRPREHREARHRGRLQRRGLDLRRARRRGAQVRAQDPVHREDQPQRVPDLPEQVRPDHVRHASSRRATWARSRSARRSTSARDESTRQIVEVAQAFQQAHELGMATVLWCYLRNNAFKTDGEGLPRRRPTSPARPTTSASRSRPTSSSRSCPRTTAATRPSAPRRTLRQDRQARLHRADDRPPDRPDAATRWPTATWAAPA